MNGLWWAQTVLTLMEVAGVFWGVKHIFRIKVETRWRWIWSIGVGIFAVLTIYQRTCLMYSRWWLVITILFCVIFDSAYKRWKMLILIFQALYYETLYCLDLFLYIAFKMLQSEHNFLMDQFVILPERIIVYLVSRTVMVGILTLLYENRGEVIQCLKSGKLIWGVVGILEYISLIICDSIFLPGMESKSIDGWKCLLFFYPFLLAILAFFFIWQRYHLVNAQIKFQNELYASRFQAMERGQRQRERIYHDFRNHFLVLRKIVSDGNICRAREYLERLLEPENSTEIRLGLPSLDYLIQVKVSAAKAQNIEVREEYEVFFSELGVEEIMDWCVLLGNLWDNALEGCRQVEGARWIQFSLRREEGIVAVNMKNCCLDSLDVKRLMSAKTDQGMHGIGIKNIEYVVAKYDGVIEQRCKDGVFVTQIVIIFK